MKTKLIFAMLCSSLMPGLAYSMGQNPKSDIGDKLSIDEYLNISSDIGPKVDNYRKDDELAGKTREIINIDSVDKCFDDDEAHSYFSDQISYYASEMLKNTPAKVGFIGSSYGTSSDDNKYTQTSLIRHPLCMSTSKTLASTMKKVPNQTTIDKLNRFANTINTLRIEAINGDQIAKKELLGNWTKFFSCLAYSESLGSSDSTTSKNVAAKNAPSSYRKPAGVEFYEDRAQPAVSRLNIGMFQFTPNSAGNVQPCIRAWNQINVNKSSCQINQKASQSDLIKILGSSLQSFNAFCGVHKLIQTFAIQVNTTKTSATHPSNLINGKLKSSELRCVTPHFYSGWAYNHFGPFQNSTGSNMNEMFNCIENSR